MVHSLYRSPARFLPYILILLATAGAAVLSANAAASGLVAFVGCGVDGDTVPAATCHRGDPIGAFFESRATEVIYEVCVLAPSGKTTCLPDQVAAAGTRYVNDVTISEVGRYEARWWVEGTLVSPWSFEVLPSRRLLWPGVTFADRPGHAMRKPTRISLGPDAINSISGWRDWGGESAKAHGTLLDNNCVPDCALGKISRIPAKVVLSMPLLCGSVDAYRRLKYFLPYQPPRGRRHVTLSFAFVCEEGGA